MKLKGVVLAGGKSSRFGEDKALARVGGVGMLERAIRLLENLSLDPVIITNASRDYSHLHCRIETDLIPEKGPLGGIYTACRFFDGMSLVVLTCDMPVMDEDALKKLIKHHTLRHDVTVYQNDDKQPQPFPGVYESRISTLLRKQIESGRWAMADLLNQVATVGFVSQTSGGYIFTNVNYKSDLTPEGVSGTSPLT